MIKTEYLLLDPAFKPTRALDRSAGYDLRAYLEEEPIFTWKGFRHSSVTSTCIDGKPVDYTRLTDDKLHEYDPLGRFVYLLPGEKKIISAGFKVRLSTDTPNKIATMLICSRSGLACVGGLTVINAPGIIDEDYPGAVGVGLINHSQSLHIISHGCRIAQALFIEAEDPEEVVLEKIAFSGNRSGGFNSTGTK